VNNKGFRKVYETHKYMLRVFKCKRSKSEVLRACKLQDGLMNVIRIGVINFTSLWRVIWAIHEFGCNKNGNEIERFLKTLKMDKRFVESSR
jgi:hypothetical protein